MKQDLTFVPTTKNKANKAKKSGEWLDFDEPLIVSTVGMRGGGKTGISDYMLQKYYNNHFTVLHLFSARSLENLYPMVNKNCGLHFLKLKQLIRNNFPNNDNIPKLDEDEIDYYIKLAERGEFISNVDKRNFFVTQKGFDLINNKLLHCDCHKALPVLLLVPDYIDFNQETVDRFNDAYWQDMKEYAEHNSEITTEQKRLLSEGNLLKPNYLRPKPKIKIVQFAVPTTELRITKFRKQWLESVLLARDEHRVLVMSPLFFEGADKFVTLEGIATYHATMMNLSGEFERLTEKDIKKPYKYWTKKQKNYHKIALFIDEARSVIPSSKLHGEAGAGKSKKALFDKVPEMRHYKTWLFFFYQNPMDIYDGVRTQDNMTVMKRSHAQLAGADWKWVFDRIELDRFGFVRKATKGKCDKLDKLKRFEQRNPKLKKFLDERRPRLEDLPSDKAYVVRFGNIRLIKNSMGSWHHKQEMESIKGDTGLSWTINREKRPEDTTKSKKESTNEKKKLKAIKEDIYKRMKHSKLVDKKEWHEIGAELVKMQQDGIIPDMGYENKDGDYFSNLFGRWKKKYESVPTQ